MAGEERREHERIDIQMPTRMWLDEEYRGKPILFEGFSRTLDLAIGGTFLESKYLLPVGFPINLEMQLEGGEQLLVRGEVVRTRSTEEDPREPGMGIKFTAVDAENRERLLRFFVTVRIQAFYSERFVVEFPHLKSLLSLQDIALIINLWEDREERLTSLKQDVTAAAAKKQLVGKGVGVAKSGKRGR